MLQVEMRRTPQRGFGQSKKLLQGDGVNLDDEEDKEPPTKEDGPTAEEDGDLPADRDGPTVEEDGDYPPNGDGPDNSWDGFPPDPDEVPAEGDSEELQALMPDSGSPDHTSMFYMSLGTSFGNSYQR